MLFKADTLARISTGEVTAAFRRWARPTVKAGGTLRTAAGVLAIDAVSEIDPREISLADAVRAGFADLAALLTELDHRPEGRCYRIDFHVAGADPRIALRERDDLAPADLAALASALAALDRRAEGPWTAAALDLIARRDGTTAGELAAHLELDKPLLKRRIRRLKEFGLTESLEVGYRLSPRGRRLLAALPQKISG